MVYYGEESQFASNNNDWILAAAAAVDQQQQLEEEEEEEDGAESDYSLDYEYLGPRKPNYRNEQDADSDASELSCSSLSCQEEQKEQETQAEFGFDMWDEDPYSTNDFTWESNDMRLTGFIKKRQKQLNKINSVAPWSKNASFWRKEKGWPRQLPSSSSTTNHDQSASALSLVLSDYGISEKLHAVYRDRIVECGKFNSYTSGNTHASSSSAFQNDNQDQLLINNSSSAAATAIANKNDTTYLENYASPTNNSNNDNETTTAPNSGSGSSSNIFNETHASISLSKTIEEQQKQYLEQEKQHLHHQQHQQLTSLNNSKNLLSKFIPYTKYIKRSQFPVIFPQDAYIALGFEPLCLAEKYGYIAIGGVEGEFELYCCMDQTRPPIKIWGTKFKGKNNIIFMTNAVQIVRWKNLNSSNTEEQEGDDYRYFLIACMNDAGILIYDLPSHHQCHPANNTTTTIANCDLHCHIKCFDHVPINDARVSPNGQYLVCVGDDACIFHLTVSYNQQKNRLVFGTPQKIKIPPSVLLSHPLPPSSDSPIITFSSQYVAWSKSSLFFAHTSDTHNYVIVWRTSPKFEMLYRIDAGGYTYAIQFHPEQEGVLAFSNRYGYLHTVNLNEAITREDPHQIMSVADFDKQQQSTINNGLGHVCVKTCQKEDSAEAIHHTHHISARHEMTMISFRGEKNRKLRILAKINGLQWSRDGSYLYVSTKKRVLAYEFMQSSCQIQSLEKIASLKALSILEEESEEEQEADAATKKKRKQQDHSLIDEKKRRKLWYKKWRNIPPHVRNNVLGDTHHLASHW